MCGDNTTRTVFVILLLKKNFSFIIIIIVIIIILLIVRVGKVGKCKTCGPKPELISNV